MKLSQMLVLIAPVALAMGGCAGDSDETASLNTESSGPPRSTKTMEEFTCDLRISCNDGVKIEQSVNALAECDALEQKSHTFDTSECHVMFSRGSELLRDIKVSLPLR